MAHSEAGDGSPTRQIPIRPMGRLAVPTLWSVMTGVALAAAVVAIALDLVVPGPVGSAGSQGAPGLPATHLWAVVAADGTLIRGSGVSNIGFPNIGEYQVRFDQTVSSCNFVATLDETGVAFPPPGFVNAAEEPGLASGVQVWTYADSTATTPTNMSFDLAVFC